MTVVRADEDAAAGMRDGSLDGTAGLERPHDPSVACVERIDLAEPVPDVEPVTDEQGRALARADVAAPAHLAPADGECDHLAVTRGIGSAPEPVQEGLVHRAVLIRADGRGRRDAVMRVVVPRDGACARVDRDDVTVGVGEKQAPVGDCRRELDERPPARHPGDPKRRMHGRRRPDVKPGVVVAEHRPDDPGPVRHRFRHRSRDELDRRRAAELAGRSRAMARDPGPGAGGGESRHRDRDQNVSAEPRA